MGTVQKTAWTRKTIWDEALRPVVTVPIMNLFQQAQLAVLLLL